MKNINRRNLGIGTTAIALGLTPSLQINNYDTALLKGFQDAIKKHSMTGYSVLSLNARDQPWKQLADLNVLAMVSISGDDIARQEKEPEWYAGDYSNTMIWPLFLDAVKVHNWSPQGVYNYLLTMDYNELKYTHLTRKKHDNT